MENIWQFVKEEFQNDIPRLTAVYVKEDDGSIGFTTPTGENTLGYYFNYTTKTSYNLPPKFKIEWGQYEYPNAVNLFGVSRALHEKQEYYPSMIKSSFAFEGAGISGTERMGQIIPGALTWSFDLHSLTTCRPLKNNMYTLLSSEETFSIEEEEGGVVVHFEDMDYFITTNLNYQVSVHNNEFDMRASIVRKELDKTVKNGHYLLFEHSLFLNQDEDLHFDFGFSTVSMDKAIEALDDSEMEEKIAQRWNKWFLSLPILKWTDDREKKVYYKAWWTIKNNYYDHPAWGHSITESLPVYKGIWQWAIPSVEWHDDQNTDYASQWIKKAMNMMLAAQNDSGYITHAIYIDEEVPGERWRKNETIQTPHFPWTAIRYYRATGDLQSLKEWYQPLVDYYHYLCKSRDKDFYDLHLWGITSSFDTGLDTTSAFPRVTYGEEGFGKENFCYPAIFAAERWRYELAMGEISELLGKDSSFWTEEAAKTKLAADNILWDDKKKWYGVLHEDRHLDTRVGVDGLFVFAYKMVSEEKAKLMEDNMKKLIGPYGIRTVARGELGFRESCYWRGASWPKSCSVGISACLNYYPHLMKEAMDGIINMCLAHPGIWECYNVDDGSLARSDHGFLCSPGMSSNVGAGDIIGCILMEKGFGMYDMDMQLPKAEYSNFHMGGLRITLEERNGKLVASAKAQEANCADVTFAGNKTISLEAGKESVVE